MTATCRVIPALLTLALGGCVVTPATTQPARMSSGVGVGPDAAIRVGITTRAEAIAKLGTPQYFTADARAYGYVDWAVTGKATGLLMGPCAPYFGTATVYKPDDVWLEFDSKGILKRFEKHLVERSDNNAQRAWQRFLKTFPADNPPR